MLVSFKVNIHEESIRVLGCYAPSSDDAPEYFLDCEEPLNNSQDTHGIFLGYLNTTLDPKLDRQHYKGDNHIKSRIVINSWIESNDLLDFLD